MMTTWKTTLGAASLWGVGFLDDGRDVPISNHDIDRDAVAADAALDALQVARNGSVLLLSTLPGIATVWPFAVACARGERDAYFADATVFDATRTEMFTRRIAVDAILGLNSEVLTGLGEMGDPYAVLRRSRVVAAEPPLVDELRAHDVHAVRWLTLGPMTALDCSQGSLHYDDSQWTLSPGPDGLRATPSLQRAVAGTVFETGVMGSVRDGMCGCGRGAHVVLGAPA